MGKIVDLTHRRLSKDREIKELKQRLIEQQKTIASLREIGTARYALGLAILCFLAGLLAGLVLSV